MSPCLCVRLCLLLVKVFTVDIVNEVARRPPKPPIGGQAVTAQLIVVRAFELLVRGQAACTPPGNLTEKSELE